MKICSISRRSALTALLALSLAAAGCGGNGQGNRDGNPNGGGNAQAREIQVDSGEFYFEPQEITVNKGETVTLVISNDGDVKHNISIDAFDVKRDYAPNETTRVTFTADQTGEFEIYCDEPGHEQSGMVGTLIVR